MVTWGEVNQCSTAQKKEKIYGLIVPNPFIHIYSAVYVYKLYIV